MGRFVPLICVGVVFCLLSATDANNPLSPPYTCTTTTTLCQPGVTSENPTIPPARGSAISRGRDGKRGPAGMKGQKGDKGDPCQCDVADEEAMENLRSIVRRLEEENSELVKNGLRAPGKSCLDMKMHGHNTSGIYFIQIGDKQSPIEVFCDMESAGGGWTLVASVHENNINGKCTQGDLWSSEQGRSASSDNSLGENWENFNTFGRPEGATSADYKSVAYFSLEASDVMIWHVPNDIEIHIAREEATLIYYTNTSFLDEYGGNLRSLFRQHFPLTKSSSSQELSTNVENLMELLQRNAHVLRNRISSFYEYVYDGNNQSISDGGNDMFDTGNRVSYQIENVATQITYNRYYNEQRNGLQVISSTSHPFLALMWIGNEDRRVQTYGLKVVGDAGADGSGGSSTEQGSLTNGDFSLQYKAFSVYGASDPSICKVFYYIQNSRWGSVVPSASYPDWSTGTAGLNHAVQFNGAPRSLLVGYTLLSRTSGTQVTDSYIRQVLTEILSTISSNTEYSCNNLDQSLTQPINYLKGDSNLVNRGIPPSAREGTEPGFIQFRPYNAHGIPSALCPTVRVTTSCRPESVCVGGITTMPDDERSCGDFGGWQGDAGDSPTKTQPSGYAKSLDDVKSSILIFTREQP